MALITRSKHLYLTEREYATAAFERATSGALLLAYEKPDERRERLANRLADLAEARDWINAAVGTPRRSLREPDDVRLEQMLAGLAADEARTRNILERTPKP